MKYKELKKECSNLRTIIDDSLPSFLKKHKGTVTENQILQAICGGTQSGILCFVFVGSLFSNKPEVVRTYLERNSKHAAAPRTHFYLLNSGVRPCTDFVPSPGVWIANKVCTVQNPGQTFRTTEWLREGMLRLQALESRKNRKKKRKFGPTQNKFRRMLGPLQVKWNRNWKIQPQIKPKPKGSKTSVKKAKSVGSRKSGLSNLSSVSTLYLKQKTKVEEARVRLKYAKQEAELLKERAALEAKMNILDKERQFEECNQGLNALNECFDLEPSDEEEEEANDSDTTDNRETRVKQYVEEQNRIAGAYSSQPNHQEPVLYDRTNSIHSNHAVPSHTETVPTTTDQGNMCEEFSKFMVKKDMLLKRIHEFDDRPEFFGSWKNTFLNIVHELNLSPAEEVDLLVQYLGPESKKAALSIQSANYSDSRRAKERIWRRLNERYARPELVESSIKQKLMSFPKITVKEVKKLYDLVDIVVEIDSLKNDEQYSSLFASYDSSAGVNLIVNKLPYQLQEKWTNEASRYKEQHYLAFPPFHFFASFLERMARVKNDPSFVYEDTNFKPYKPKSQTTSHSVFVKKVDVPVMNSSTESKTSSLVLCPLHNTNHTLNKCHQFREKPLQERLQFLRSKGLCFKCCGQKGHLAKDCRSTVVCSVCKGTNHPTALHENKFATSDQDFDKNNPARMKTEEVTSACTMLCGRAGASKSCAKTVLVKVYPRGNPEKAISVYAIIDEQSNRSLARSAFLDSFGIPGPEMPYTLSSCSGNTTEYGRRCSNFTIESFDSSYTIDLPTLIECDQIPNIRDEIPSRKVAEAYSHLKDIAEFIPPVQESAEILLLIGRDLLPAHHVLEQRIGPMHAPFAQRLRLGWVIIGNICLGTAHQQNTISVMKTFTLKDGRTTLLEPCHNSIHVEENCVFSRTSEDNLPGLSIDDKDFLHLMETEIYKAPDGSWTAPLPFRRNRQRLPNNKSQALRRAYSLDVSLRKNPEKMEHVIAFMRKILENGHAEPAQHLDSHAECWYLPLFAVYHPKKPGSVRCVFDSSAKYEGISLNDVLLTGPDLVNSLLGILLRFRQHPVAVTADIEQMFYRFSVSEKHRDYLRFMWYKDNDPSQDLIEYRMTRHVFGNSPSPAVATFGLRKCVNEADDDVKNFVERNFYVDDGLMSFDGSEKAVDLLCRTQKTLKEEGNIRLHKISSNCLDVIKSFPEEDLAKEVTGIKLDLSEAPLQRSLGVSWDISKDSFTFQVSSTKRPFTKRGVLATINGLYDLIGFVAPVTIQGKFILQDLMSSSTDWDEPLPQTLKSYWSNWVESLPELQSILIPRCYVNLPSSDVKRRELHIFSDASQRAISAVAYLKMYSSNGDHVSFIHGKAKVAPSQGHTIPRLELCAAVLATKLKDTIMQHLSIPIDSIAMYTDSRVVLGYINNEHRRFYVYVGNRVDRIRHSTTADQWNYVSSEDNPADIGTRSIPAGEIGHSAWLQGPSILKKGRSEELGEAPYELVDPDEDREVRPLVISSKKTSAKQHTSFGVHRFERFSTWWSLLRAIARIKRLAMSFQKFQKTSETFVSPVTPDELSQSELFIVNQVQCECFPKEVSALMEGRELHRTSSIISLSPILDSSGIMRVGGRLRHSKGAEYLEVHPVIIPKGSHIADLLIRHYHASVHHQGRHITEGKIRMAGYWVVGCKRKVTSFIHSCVTCRKLRGRFGTQVMADLPEDRLTPSPPFTFVGVDTFGPWNVVARRTRGGQANQKRWAVIFTCLVCRAIHLEVIEELSSSSFINALKRFMSIRGPVRQFRSDRGTNFVGAVNELNIDSISVEDPPVKNFLTKNQAIWIFNPPHASHFGGVWERMIGVTRRILDGMLLRTDSKGITNEVLVTFMAEVSSIVNSRPFVAVSTDPDDPSVLTPNILLTQKMDSSMLPKDLPDMDLKDAYRSHWKHVVVLSQEFWKKWRMQYLSNLQNKRKWTKTEVNLTEGDIVLLKNSEVTRDQWPMAVVERVFPSADNCVRTVQIRVAKDRKSFIRPICELIPLMRE